MKTLVADGLAGALALAGISRSADGSIGKTDIGGVARGSWGPEAGAWVIAETTELPPSVDYQVWVRG
jgi:hypothetical protein